MFNFSNRELEKNLLKKKIKIQKSFDFQREIQKLWNITNNANLYKFQSIDDVSHENGIMKTKVEELNGRLNTEKEKRKQLENGIKEKEIKINTDSSELNRIQNEVKDKTQKIPLLESERTELQDLADKVCRPGNNISFHFESSFKMVNSKPIKNII